MLSIGIPTYNTDISTLVHMIHKQATLAELTFEIIIYDDASTIKIDANTSISTLPHLIYTANPTNKGRTATRNSIAQKARYDWLLFLDADTIPVSENFIKNYLQIILNNPQADIIFGGIAYTDKIPPKEQYLRWLYGKEKESKKASERSKQPHFIISQNLLIKKQLFLSLNTYNENLYGLDNIFSSELKRRNTHVIHIDNEAYHQGLESNEIFLKKSIDSLKTTVLFEKRGIIQNNLRPIQRIYNRLSSLGITRIVAISIRPFEGVLHKNLLGKRPSLLLFDLYRIYHYIQLKKNENA